MTQKNKYEIVVLQCTFTFESNRTCTRTGYNESTYRRNLSNDVYSSRLENDLISEIFISKSMINAAKKKTNE
jgi:hypothetical protein